MIEIYADIPEQVREQAKFIFDMAILQKDIVKIIEILNNYTQTITDEYEKEFIMFYFHIRMEQMLNESNNVKR